MKKYGVLVVDDSAVMRKNISLVVENSEHFKVIGKARNGLDALEKIAYLKPDLIIMDIEMPKLNGVEALKMQMKKQPVPIILLDESGKNEVEAMDRGAIACFEKSYFLKHAMYDVELFVKQRKMLLGDTTLTEEVVNNQAIAVNDSAECYTDERILIIGSSTGGPAALQTILTNFPTELHIPVVIIQHMPEGFTKSLANRFNELCVFEVKEATHLEQLKAGTVYIAPAGLQTLVKQNIRGQYFIHLEQTTSYQTLYKPSIDVALLSVAKQAKNQMLVVILTGMGDDGLYGCKDVKAHGGTIFTESEETCVVYGMPKVVTQAGLADKELPLHEMAKEIERYFKGGL